MINLDNKEEIIKSQGGENVIKSVNFLKDQLSQSFNEALAINYPTQYKNAKKSLFAEWVDQGSHL